MNILADYLNKYYAEVPPFAFYHEIFPDGELESAHESPDEYEKGRYTGIVIEKTNIRQKRRKADGSIQYKELAKRYTITDDLDALDALFGRSPYFCFMSPLSYAGKRRTMMNARFMYALVVEIDFLQHGQDPADQYGLQNLLDHLDGGLAGTRKRGKEADVNNLYPRPTYIVASGNGVHLYYVLEQPLPLFQNIVESLEHYKTMLTKALWSKHITSHYKQEQIEFEPVWQGFRVVGTLTKKGVALQKDGQDGYASGDVCRAFAVGDKVSVDYLNQWATKAKNRIIYQYRSRSGLTLAEAKERYPEWYEARIVQGLKKRPWEVNRSLYDWWKRRLIEEVDRGGKRYYCLMMLVIYAVKCSFYHPKKNPHPVTYEELEKDCYELMERFEALHYVRENGVYDPFTEYDVECALQVYNASYATYPINSIIYRSGLEIEKNKRNYRKQAEHVKVMSAIRDIDHPDGSWRNKDGAPSKKQIVKDWQAENPDGTKYQCQKDTGLSKSTVYKWWQK